MDGLEADAAELHLYYRFPIELFTGEGAILGVSFLALVVAVIVGGGPPAAWLIVLGGAGFSTLWLYWFSTSDYELVVEGNKLSWRSMRGSGSVQVSDLIRVRPRLYGSTAWIEVSGGRPLRVPITSNFPRFVTDLAGASPDLDAWTSGYLGVWRPG